MIENLSFSWPGQKKSLIKVERLQIKPGEKVFLYGPSGSGKTTFLGLLGGVIKAQSGRVELLGQDLSQMSAADSDRFRASHIGYIFQLFNLLPFLSVLENCCLPLEFSNSRQQKLDSKNHSAEDEAKELLNSLQFPSELVKSSVEQLSVGQQQRVAAVRALIGSPEIIVADEPTSALDRSNTESFLELLFRKIDENGSTLVFVSHDVQLADKFDKSMSIEELNQ